MILYFFFFLLLLMIYQSDKTLYHITIFIFILFTLCINEFYLFIFYMYDKCYNINYKKNLIYLNNLYIYLYL